MCRLSPTSVIKAFLSLSATSALELGVFEMKWGRKKTESEKMEDSENVFFIYVPRCFSVKKKKNPAIVVVGGRATREIKNPILEKYAQLQNS